MAKSSLSELLHKKKESYEAEATRNKEIIDEWVEAVGQLFGQLKAWLNASDPEKLLRVEEVRTEVNEPNVGCYHAPRLNIRAFGKWVGIIPKARKTVGTARPPQSGAPAQATGRVDITDEVRRYVLYRFGISGENSWFIENPVSGCLDQLTQERFEDALTSYFQ